MQVISFIYEVLRIEKELRNYEKGTFASIHYFMQLHPAKF